MPARSSQARQILIAQAWTGVPRDVLDRYRVVIAIDEVYPALETSRGNIAPWVQQLLVRSGTAIPANHDVRDAVICAALALAHCAAGRREGLPVLVGPEGADAATARVEGWVYAPARSTG